MLICYTCTVLIGSDTSAFVHVLFGHYRIQGTQAPPHTPTAANLWLLNATIIPRNAEFLIVLLMLYFLNKHKLEYGQYSIIIDMCAYITVLRDTNLYL